MQYVAPWVLSTLGATLLVTQSKIFKPLRDLSCKLPFLGTVLHCSMCFGFWFGLALGIYNPILGPGSGLRFYYIIDGLVSSYINWISYVVLARLGANNL